MTAGADKQLPPDFPVGRHFLLGEFTASDTAAALGHDVVVLRNSLVADAVRRLCLGVLDPWRDDVGVALLISSGYRPEWLNREVGGAPDSQHTRGEAADVYSHAVWPADLARAAVRLGLPFDQLIVEHDKGVVHVSHVYGRNRREVKTRWYDEQSESYVYRDGVLDRDARHDQ